MVRKLEYSMFSNLRPKDWLPMAALCSAAEELMKSDAVRKIGFTGSTRVGKMLMSQAAATVKKVRCRVDVSPARWHCSLDWPPSPHCLLMMLGSAHGFVSLGMGCKGLAHAAITA